MIGETDLVMLLRNLQPRLDPRSFVFCSVDAGQYQQLKITPLGMFHESEGITLILESNQAQAANLTYTEVWALITLNIHSSLTAVGFLAKITTKLARAGLSVNAISAFYHDHLFVLWEEKERAMAILKEFEQAS